MFFYLYNKKQLYVAVLYKIYLYLLFFSVNIKFIKHVLQEIRMYKFYNVMTV